jgi:biopolymer transport protein ExbD
MSHGGGDSIASPNLTPLLDVVLQLLMFFMMCVNFVNDQVNAEIHLPESQSAKPMDKSETEVLFLNLRPFSSELRYWQQEAEKASDSQRKAEIERYINALQGKFTKPDEVCVLLNRSSGGEDKDNDKPLPATANELKFWLKTQADDARKRSADKNTVDTAIILRADADTEYSRIYQVLNICKAAKFKTLKLRATSKNKPRE